MRYSIVDNRRAEAEPGLKGVCQYCESQMIPKCGRYVVWHWAHRRRADCDPWWESETDWHRSWKDRFSPDWQEVVHVDPATGEKHIADVKTPHGLVIEVQNSPLHPEEMRSRERFYKKIVWVVNGNRRGADGRQETLDRNYFHMGRYTEPVRSDPLAFPVEWYGRSKLLHNWSRATVDVYFDFDDGILWKLDSFEPNKTIIYEDGRRTTSKLQRQDDLFPESTANQFPRRIVNWGVFTPIRIEDFVEGSKEGNPVQGGFGVEDVGVFSKELVPVSEIIDDN